MNRLTTNASPPPPPVAPPSNPNELLAKRKRGRPRKDDTSSQMSPQPMEDLVGQRVSGVVVGKFEAGYMLNLKVKDSDKKLSGVVFMPGKVTPVTPENDVAPGVKFYERNQIKNLTIDQSVPSNDQPMAESSQALSLIPPNENNGQVVQAKEGVMDKGKQVEEGTRLVEFFPTPEATTTEMVKDQPQQSLVLYQKETEQQKSPGGTEAMEVDKVVDPGEKVPEMLQLELGNKAIVNGDNNNSSVTTEAKDPETSDKTTNPDASDQSKSGFIANLFEGGEKKGDADMEEGKEATTNTTPSVE